LTTTSDPATTQVTGAEALVAAAAAAGITVCFANPGTTEMSIVTALDLVGGVRAVLGLHENVCTGAADGYARIAGRPALTLLHLGPGLANGLANLHNARRAHSPVVNLVGDHASWHRPYDAALTSDIAGVAGTVGTVLTTRGRHGLAHDMDEAVASAARRGVVSTLIVPADHQQTPGTEPSTEPRIVERERVPVPAQRVAELARLVESGGDRVVLLLGGNALGRRAQEAAGRIAAATGARLYSETFPARAERGGGLPAIDRLPYFPETAIKALAGCQVVLVGADAPVAYFGYEGIPSRLAPEHLVRTLSALGEDGEQALVDMAAVLAADDLAADDLALAPAPPLLPDRSASLDGVSVGTTLAALLPEGAIVSVEGGTCGYPFFTASAGAVAHTSLTNTGGAIGQGLPVALGAAIAAPDRPVIALQSDGSGLYTAQALWTMAREQCEVVVLIAANNVYNVLRTELGRHGNHDLGTQARNLTSLGEPALDWTDLARGFGVPATRATTVGELSDQFTAALGAGGPHLIEMAM
jgi:acetolactate synthase-1/2/3 large subunit